jgi:hypothetical protein
MNLYFGFGGAIFYYFKRRRFKNGEIFTKFLINLPGFEGVESSSNDATKKLIDIWDDDRYDIKECTGEESRFSIM